MRRGIPLIRYFIKADIYHNQNKNNKREWKYQKTSLIITTVAAIATSIMAYLTYGLAGNSLKQAEISREQVELFREQMDRGDESFKLENRAYIMLDSMVVTGGRLPIDTMTTIQAQFKNTGKTPAKHVAFSGKVKIVDTSIILAEEITDTTFHTWVIGPNKAFICESDSFKVNNREIDLIESGKLEIVVFFKVRYTDFFDDNHFTTICSIYSLAFNDFSTCEQLNDAN